MLDKVENLLSESDSVRIYWRSNHYTGIYTFKLKYLSSSNSFAFHPQAHSLSLTSVPDNLSLTFMFLSP